MKYELTHWHDSTSPNDPKRMPRRRARPGEGQNTRRRRRRRKLWRAIARQLIVI